MDPCFRGISLPSGFSTNFPSMCTACLFAPEGFRMLRNAAAGGGAAVCCCSFLLSLPLSLLEDCCDDDDDDGNNLDCDDDSF